MNRFRQLRYVLITPARNEKQYIRLTIESVVGQTRLPLKWVIVSDGSTDRTDEIVAEYLDRYAWMELVRMPEHSERHFAAKVQAFNAGYERVQGLDFDVVGSLDADISFGNDYFEFLIAQFEENPFLGVAGTPFVENGVHYDYRFTNIEHVSGACQLFRRNCFEEIGGYTPIKGGGIDWVAVTTARMKGWQTRTFTEKTCNHHRKMGTETADPLLAGFRQGKKDYFLGGHPLWQLLRSIYQMTRPPYILGGLCVFAGYYSELLQKKRPGVSCELKEFNQAEQLQRLKKKLRY